MILLKVCSSMKAQDLPPSRLERAIYKMKDLLAVRGQEPTGLIAYSGSAHLVMPLTKDTRIIALMAGELAPDGWAQIKRVRDFFVEGIKVVCYESQRTR